MLLQEVKRENISLKVFDDEDYCLNPREDFDNLGTMICFSRNHNIGDGHEYNDTEDFWMDLAFDYCYNSDTLEEKSIEELQKIVLKHIVILPIYIYDHSGITISTSSFGCSWDSGLVGYIYVTKEKVRKEFGVKRISSKFKEKILTYLKNEVDTYDYFLRGEVCSYEIADIKSNEILDSCNSFFGYDLKENGMLDTIPSAYNNLVKLLN